MGSTVEDKYLILSLRDSKGNGATRLRKMFSEKWRYVNGVKILMKKLITPALSIDYRELGHHDGLTSVTYSTWFCCLKSETSTRRLPLWVCGSPSWPSARPSTSLMLTGVNIYLQRYHCCKTDLQDVRTWR